MQLGLSEGAAPPTSRAGENCCESVARRGVCLAAGPGIALPLPIVRAFVAEPLMDKTVEASLAFASSTGGGTTAPAAVATLADRVIKTMLLSRLSLLVSLMVAAATTPTVFLGLLAFLAAGIPQTEAARPGPGDLAGRVVDEAGSGVPDAQLWAVVGSWGERKTIATAVTDTKGRFVLTRALDHDSAKAAIAAGHFGLFTAAPDGRVGWLATIDRGALGMTKMPEIVVRPVGEVTGRVIDQDGAPIEGAKITPLMIDRVGNAGEDDSFNLNPEVIDSYVTTTGKDGSFVLKHTPRSAWVRATIEAPGIGWLHFWWDSTRPTTFTFDRRRGQIKGRIKLPDVGVLTCSIVVRARLDASTVDPIAHSVKPGSTCLSRRDWMARSSWTTSSRAVTLSSSTPTRLCRSRPERICNVEVQPGSIVTVELAAVRLPTITGRVVDLETGKGLAGVPSIASGSTKRGMQRPSRGENQTPTDGIPLPCHPADQDRARRVAAVWTGCTLERNPRDWIS